MDPPRLTTIPANGLQLAVWEWPGAEPALLFAHATGFHGRSWDQIARRFPERRRIALDFRGHGRSSKPDPPYRWTGFASDLTAVAESLGLERAVGVGHSMGGHSVVAAAIERPSTFSALVLIDATILSPERYGTAHFDVSFILRRRAIFQSPEEMWERFRHRPPFVRWQPEALRDYCEYGLLPSAPGVAGRFVLACPPAVEASIYEHSKDPSANLYAGIPSVAQPVLVMRAGSGPLTDTFDMNASPTAPDLASRFPRGRDLLLAEHNHFIPMEAPDLVADWIGRYLPPGIS